MRKTFIQTVSQLASNNNKIQVLLGDISVFAFKKNNQLPPNIYNMGILEQSMVAFGAGLSAEGYFPIVHTISPFIIERAFEQIKVNFCLNNLPGILITVGGVCDYYSLGRTHHCPNDMSIISTLPNIEFACPKNEESLIKMGLSTQLVEKLLPYINMSGSNAKEYLKENPLELSAEEQTLINSRSKASYTADIINQYESKTGFVFADLSAKQQTVIASIGYQYGNFDRTPKFLKHLKNNDWNGVSNELLNFKDDFPTRRQTEERYLNN